MFRGFLFFAAVTVLAPPFVQADEMRVKKEIRYSDAGKGSLTCLDLYAPADGEGHPVIIWIHGGGWRAGDKGNLQQKPEAFTSKGFIFVSVNYRLYPNADFRVQGRDLAAAIRFVREHVGKVGGDAGSVFLMGHSAGAHLAALVATDEHYLQKEGLGPDDLRGVILLDGAGYDIPRHLNEAKSDPPRQLYTSVFGTEEARQQDASPIFHVESGKGIPPFLILHVANREESKIQSERFAERLRTAGIAAEVVPAEGKTHGTINRELGRPGDAPTQTVFAFLKRQTAQAEADKRPTE